MVKKKFAKFVEGADPSAFKKWLPGEASILPHHAPSPCKCVHSQAWQLRKARPPKIVQPSHFATSYFFPAWPLATAITIVTELMIRIKVIKLTKASGIFISPMKGKDLKTSFGLGQPLLEKRMVP